MMISYFEDNSDPYQREQTSSAFLGKAKIYRSMLANAGLAKPSVPTHAGNEQPAGLGNETSTDSAEDAFEDVNLI